MIRSSKSSALASRSRALVHRVRLGEGLLETVRCAWPAKASSSISSFFRLEILALKDFGGKRFGSRSRSRQTSAISRLESAAS